MGKMIVGNSLKNNNEFKDNTKKEIEFVKKYQILSEHTQFFEGILNDIENKKQLIEVKLNKNDNISNIYLGNNRFISVERFDFSSSNIYSITKKSNSPKFYSKGGKKSKGFGININKKIILLAIGLGLMAQLDIKIFFLFLGIIIIWILLFYQLNKLKVFMKILEIRKIVLTMI